MKGIVPKMASPARDLYETDFYAWTQDQAARLRALDGDNRFDVAHVAEEIEDLGKNRRDALNSHARLALQHLVLLAASPAPEPRCRWAEEVANHRDALRDLLDSSPSLAAKADLDTAWRRGLRGASQKLDWYDEPKPALPHAAPCPLNLTDLTTEDLDIAQALERVRQVLGES